MLRIGTSGWHYKDWRERFYPKGMPPNQYLSYYAEHFNTVELNGVFYRLPTVEAVQGWYKNSPKNFLFAYKGSRFITHMKKLREPEEALKTMFERARHLKEKLAVILWQLPPFFTTNIERLKDFLKALPSGHRYAVEFRHPSWYSKETLAALTAEKVGLCLHDMKGSIAPIAVTSRTVYVRFHGTGDKKYHGGYSKEQLRVWADRIRPWLREKRDVFVYFNNDYYGMAIQDAKKPAAPAPEGA